MRTIKNDYLVNFGGTCTIFVKRKGETHEVLIDSDDLDLVDSMLGTWLMNADGYIWMNGKRPERKIILIHRLIMGVTSFTDKIDHINFIKTDNRKSNLRVVTNGENMQNRSGTNTNNRSGYRGVFFNKRHNRWQAQYKLDRKQVYVGLYETVEEAANAAESARKENMTCS